MPCSRCGARYREEASCGKTEHETLPPRPNLSPRGFEETTIVQITIRGTGAGLAAAFIADQITQLHEVGGLIPHVIEMEEGEIDPANLTIEINTVAPAA